MTDLREGPPGTAVHVRPGHFTPKEVTPVTLPAFLRWGVIFMILFVVYFFLVSARGPGASDAA
ncbi:conserved protein of unknown function [Kyrpidia spormannii]|uniref:Uncharacterized protein n=1 Tax=Kyrpidia spormannii TaxID=2055160 RepID=A0A6F9EFH0_9BACL|nr:conserved protein of unknown function [Kyrpidia spormannii]